MTTTTKDTKVSISTTAGLASRIGGSFDEVWSVRSIFIVNRTGEDGKHHDNSGVDGGVDVVGIDASDEPTRSERCFGDHRDL